MVLKAVVAIYGVLMLLGAELLLLSGAHLLTVLYLAVNGALIAGGVIFEQSSYRPRLTRGRGQFEATGERFLDPVSKHLIEVHYNATTGQRDYVDTEAAPEKLPA